MVEKPLKDKKIVDLATRRSGRSDVAFGAAVNRGGEHDFAANEQALGILANIHVDETLPFYVASLDGTVVHLNDHYLKLDEGLVEMTPGSWGLRYCWAFSGAIVKACYCRRVGDKYNSACRRDRDDCGPGAHLFGAAYTHQK